MDTETENWFGYAFWAVDISALAESVGLDSSVHGYPYIAERIVFNAKLTGRQVRLVFYAKEGCPCLCFALATQSRGTRLPLEPPPEEEYAVLKELLKTDEPPQWLGIPTRFYK